jgi:hypothetical protein
MIICPAVTSVSLFASAISFPALIASIVGRIPIIPTIAVTTICESFQDAAASNPSIPDKISTSRSAVFIFSSAAFSSFHTAAIDGLNSRICFSRSSMLFPAASAVIFISLFVLTISSVWVPIEPVDPKTAILFISLYLTSASVL